jgi:hypothetical protein
MAVDEMRAPVVHWPSDPVPTGPNAPAGSLPTVAPLAAGPRRAPARQVPALPVAPANGTRPAAPTAPPPVAPVAPVAPAPVPRAPLMYPPVDRSSATPPEPIQPDRFRPPTGEMPPVQQRPAQPRPVSPQAVVPPAPVVPVPAGPVPVFPGPAGPVPVSGPSSATTARLPEPVTAIPVTAPAMAPVTAVPVTAIVSPVPAPVVTPTSIVPASPGYPVNPAAAWRSPAWPAQPQLPANAGHTGYPTGGYPAVTGAQTGGYPIVHALPAGNVQAPEAVPRSRPPVGVLLLGLLIGLLVFGSTGYLIGSTTNGSTVDDAPAGQEQLNRSRLNPTFVPLADAWVPWVGGCRSSSEAGGPAPQPGERVRVKCSVNAAIDVYFIQFRSAADRDTVRAARATQNATSARIAAGAVPVVAQRAGTSGRTTGHYVEFAYQAGGRTYGGIYWDDDNTTGAYIEKQWTDGDGGWLPLRDTWQRYT